ncbi:MAG: hypothetical protein JO312_26075 [Hyphomicrobiales bacterium]|nr:hypothetical protein [Hyphomicrobiales bacterium]
MTDTSAAAGPTPAASGASGAPAGPGGPDSITAYNAGLLGAGLVALGLLAFVGTVAITSSSAPSSLAFAAMSGVALLSLTLVGIMVLTRAVGMTDGTQALGLPQGSVRALLAFALAIVFVAVASWTLGGLFDPMGPEVAKDQGATADVETFLKPYENDRYIIVETQPDAKTSAASVYLRREAPEKDVVDIAKQIVTISATVLVTIVGFYFGSKSTTDVAKSVNDSLAAVRRTIVETQSTLSGGAQNAPGGAAAAAPATADDIARAASAAAALATATAAKLQTLGASPMDILRQAVAGGKGGDAAKAALTSAEASFATLSDRAKACADAGARAVQLAQGMSGANRAALDLANGKLQDLLSGATQANHEFEQAFGAFADARQKILAATAK